MPLAVDHGHQLVHKTPLATLVNFCYSFLKSKRVYQRVKLAQAYLCKNINYIMIIF